MLPRCWRDGRAEAYRGVRRAVVHPDYVYSGEDEVQRVAYDVALLELDQPIMLPQLQPFATDTRPGEGAAVSVVSYAMNRSEVPSIEKGCAVLSSTVPALILSCDIDSRPRRNWRGTRWRWRCRWRRR